MLGSSPPSVACAPMSDLRITVDGDQRSVAAGTTAAQLYDGRREVVVARVGGELRDLAYEIKDGDAVEAVTTDSEDGRAVVRHSTAHMLAQAVQSVFPEARLGIGPPIRDGFYYDFDVERPFHPEDLQLLEKKMQEIQKSGQRFARRVVTEDAALEELASEPYKCELIGLKAHPETASDAEAAVEVGSGELTIYDNLDAKTGELVWRDLCRGPHVPTTRHIPAFRLSRSAAAYWRGSEKNPQLQRDLRHRVGEQGRAQGAPRLPGRGREARPPQARRRARPVLLPRRDRVRAPGLPPQGWRDQARDGGLRPRAAPGGGLPVRRDAAHHQAGAVRDLRAPAVLRGDDVPADLDGGQRLLPQGNELPDAQPDLPVARAVVPRAADPAVRVRRGVPL